MRSRTWLSRRSRPRDQFRRLGVVQTIDLREDEQCLCDGGGHAQFSMVVLALWSVVKLGLKMNSLERKK